MLVAAAEPVLLERPLPDLAAWSAHFQRAEIPVLASTVAALDELRANEEAVDAHMLAELIADDPLMVLRVMIAAASRCGGRLSSSVETVTAALVMMGISPFFRTFAELPTLESRLPPGTPAFEGFSAVLRRAERAGKFALGFAVHRMDHDAAVIHQAAMLHDFAEMLLWCHAPALALRIAERQAAEPGLRSAAAQRAVLNVELPDLQQALMKAWQLPELLVRITDDRHVDSAQVRNVMLAIRLARHSALDWNNPALPDDLRDIGDLLNLSAAPTATLVRELDG